MQKAKLKLGVLISGRGSNLQAIIDATKLDSFPAEISLVISNEPGAYGLDRAKRAGIPILTLPHRDYAGRTAFEEALDQKLRQAGVELICLAGFMRLLTPSFVEAWPNQIINIHPSLLPAYKGLHTHERAVAAQEPFTGCTVHFVRAGMDDGPIIVQASVPITTDDTGDTVAAKVLIEEHKCYPFAIRAIAESRISVIDETVLFKEPV